MRWLDSFYLPFWYITAAILISFSMSISKSSMVCPFWHYRLWNHSVVYALCHRFLIIGLQSVQEPMNHEYFNLLFWSWGLNNIQFGYRFSVWLSLPFLCKTSFSNCQTLIWVIIFFTLNEMFCNGAITYMPYDRYFADNDSQLIPCVKQVLIYLNDIFDTLLKALSDPSDEVI